MSKKLHKVHDTFVKNLLSYKESAIAFLHEALPSELISQFRWEEMIYLSESYVTAELREFVSDTVISMPLRSTNESVNITILIEHKSKAEPLSSVQLLTYIANGYDLQRKRGGKLNVIIPVIYYHGKTRWKFRPLHQLFKNIPASIHKYIPSFETEMLRVQEYSIPQIHNITEAKLRAALIAQKGLHDKMVAIQDYVRVINTLESYGTGNFLKTFFVYISNIPTFDKEKFIDITNQLTTDMRTRSMTLRDELIAEGKEEGIAIGIEKGKQEGRQEGRQEGSMQSRYEFARKLIQRNMSIENICDLTELSYEEVLALIKNEK